MDAPVLITAYCRPNLLRNLLEQVRETHGSIYIFVDSESNSDSSEKLHRIHESKKIALSFAEAQKNVNCLFAQSKLGLAKSVTRAIDWVFEREKSVVVLEDDLFLHKDTLRVANQLLTKYERSQSIGSISLYRPKTLDNLWEFREKELFSPLPTSWGWATWIDRWNLYRGDLSKERKINLLDKFLKLGGPAGVIRWSKVVRALEVDELDSWAYPWMFTHFLEGWRTVVPKINLIENLGFGELATHTRAGISNQVQSKPYGHCDHTYPLEIPRGTIRMLLQEDYGIYSFAFRLRKRLIELVCRN